MNKINILNKYSRTKFFEDPYPHFIIENVFDDRVYEELYSEFGKQLMPEFKKKDGFEDNNLRIQLAAKEIIDNQKLESSIWKDFVEYHTSKEFFLNVFQIFEKQIYKILPDVYKNIEDNKNKDNLTSVRSDFHKSRKELVKSNKNSEYVLDCQPSLTTPNLLHEKSVRGAHVDSPYKLYAGLFYLRNSNDQINGGDIDIYKCKDKVRFNHKTDVINSQSLEKVKTFKYGKNKLIMHLNTPSTIHGVSKRDVGPFHRNLVNIIAERYKEDKLFNLNYKKNFFSIFKSKITKFKTT